LAFASIPLKRSVTRPVALLDDRLTSLDEHCLTDLADALEASADGDLTHTVTPVVQQRDGPRDRAHHPGRERDAGEQRDDRHDDDLALAGGGARLGGVHLLGGDGLQRDAERGGTLARRRPGGDEAVVVAGARAAAVRRPAHGFRARGPQRVVERRGPCPAGRHVGPEGRLGDGAADERAEPRRSAVAGRELRADLPRHGVLRLRVAIDDEEVAREHVARHLGLHAHLRERLRAAHGVLGDLQGPLAEAVGGEDAGEADDHETEGDRAERGGQPDRQLEVGKASHAQRSRPPTPQLLTKRQSPDARRSRDHQ
jgi:hypothetical protein